MRRERGRAREEDKERTKESELMAEMVGLLGMRSWGRETHELEKFRVGSGAYPKKEPGYQVGLSNRIHDTARAQRPAYTPVYH